jgi:exopolysaccharide biosynthesis WecB/TagA/CpsF family protein
VEVLPYAQPSPERLQDEDPYLAAQPPSQRARGPRDLRLVAPPQGRVRVLNTWVDVIAGQEVLDGVSHAAPNRPLHLCYVNAHSLNLAYRDLPYRDALSRADLVLNDGIGLDLAARMKGCRFPENLNGSDFTLRLLSLVAEKGWRVFLHGGQPGVAASAGERLCQTITGLKVVGVRDGYTQRTDKEIIDDVRRSGADVLIVALGQPEQELWLDAHLSETGCRLGIGVGAFLDFAAGRVVRAPQWMNRLGVEWLFRLVQEPGRLWRRYIVGNPVFLWRAWRLRAGDRASDASGLADRAPTPPGRVSLGLAPALTLREANLAAPSRSTGDEEG